MVCGVSSQTKGSSIICGAPVKQIIDKLNRLISTQPFLTLHQRKLLTATIALINPDAPIRDANGYVVAELDYDSIAQLLGIKKELAEPFVQDSARAYQSIAIKIPATNIDPPCIINLLHKSTPLTKNGTFKIQLHKNIELAMLATHRLNASKNLRESLIVKAMRSRTQVRLNDEVVGSVTWNDQNKVGVFQYTAEFSLSDIQLSPIVMPLTKTPYSFPALGHAFNGLPGLVADSLPDRYGHRLIDAWLAFQGREPGSMTPVERLCFIGRSGMGALEYEPSSTGLTDYCRPLNIAALVGLANQLLTNRENLTEILGEGNNSETFMDLLQIGISAGGARTKAAISWFPRKNEFRAGQPDQPYGFEHWLLKFDGISNNRDKEVADPTGYGLVEYAYHLMAGAAGINMMTCRLHHEGGRSHFMTKRFDRTDNGKKFHIQSLAALCHFDYNDPSSYSYEQAMDTIKRISVSADHDLEQQFLRAVFNVVARNQDDHIKNIAFIMDPDGTWTLSPAFDLIYAWNPNGSFTGKHQMSVNGKRDNFESEDLLALGQSGGIKSSGAKALIAQVVDSVGRWPEFAEKAGISEERAIKIAKSHRLQLANL
jgi:serine/threonine-protein kinase HipA